MILVAYLAVLLALGMAAQGLWLTVQSFTANARRVERRFAGKASQEAVAQASAPAGGAATEADEPASEEGPIGRLLDRRAPALRRRLLAAKAPFTPTQLVLGSVGLFFVFFAAIRLTGGPLLVALLASLWGGLASPTLLISWLAKRRRKQFTVQMPQAVDLIARSLQAGHPVSTAMLVASQQMPDPIGPEFGVVVAEINYGLDREVALRHLLQRFPIPELRMFTASLEVTRETGGNLAEVFLNLGEAMRAKAQLRKKVAAISAEGRMSFWVVSILPLAVVSVIMLLRPEYYREVAADPLFWPMMAGPPTLWAIGALTIWRMINFRI